MAEILFTRDTPIGLFYWRRASRILPALWVYTGVTCVAAYLANDHPASFLNVISVLTFTLNYQDAEAGPSYLVHIWSICVEEHAYVTLSIIAVLHRRFVINLPVALGSIAFACVFSGMIQTWALHRGYYEVYWHSDVRMASVFMSAALYLQFREHRSIHPSIPIIAGMVGLAIGVSNYAPDPVKYSLGTFLLAVSLLTIEGRRSIVDRILGHPALTYFGIWSYSLYIWQQPFFVIRFNYSKPLLLIAVATVSLVSFYFVEKPVRRFLNQSYRPPQCAKETA